jgi:galactose-6-phosphate isomerase
MPTLDVSDAFDPSFFDDMIVERITETVDVHGRTHQTTVTDEFEGVVTATSPDDLIRVPEAEYMNKTITIFTQYRLRGPGEGYDADVVQWHGSRFIVRAVDDFSGYGEGFVSAVCMALSPTNPVVPRPSIV